MLCLASDVTDWHEQRGRTPPKHAAAEPPSSARTAPPTFADVDGHKITALLTGTLPCAVPGQLAGLELRHLRRSRVEGRIRQGWAANLRPGTAAHRLHLDMGRPGRRRLPSATRHDRRLTESRPTALPVNGILPTARASCGRHGP